MIIPCVLHWIILPDNLNGSVVYTVYPYYSLPLNYVMPINTVDFCQLLLFYDDFIWLLCCDNVLTLL